MYVGYERGEKVKPTVIHSKSHNVAVFIATPLVLHGGAGLLVHSGHSPHIVTHLIHEYHVNIPWISMPLHGFHDGR
jgi:hypothetical protein